jgi:predicted O-methyltransferase YrrM
MILAYLKFLFYSKNEHAIHSPFVFELYTEIIKKKTIGTEFSKIEAFRNEQLKNEKTIEIEDFGAGSKINKSNKRKISEIARNAEKPAKFGRLLYRLIKYFEPKTILDLGTSLGITTLYESAAAMNNSNIITFEGCPQTANEAKILFEKANAHNIRQIIGNIDTTLPKVLSELESVDFVFFDANHRYLPTINYFTACLAKAHEGSVFVFDDIHWSKEMEQAWEAIKANPKVLISIDLFYLGIVFFRKNQPKQYFTLRF